MGTAADGYYADGGSAIVTVHANETLTTDFALLRIRYARVQGTVRDAASHAPLSGVVVGLYPVSVTTGPDGTFISGLIPTPYPGVATPYSFNVSTFDPTLWSDTVNTTLRPDETTTADANLLRRCQSATLIGTVVNALTQQPIQGASVRWGPAIYQQTLTDVQGSYVLTDIPAGFKNSASQITLTASAANFNSQSRTITIFCGATIVMDFGRQATAFSTIEGHVTDAVTQKPIGGAFVGSEFGGSTSTDFLGFYRLINVPLGANDAPRDWKVTVQPAGFTQQNKIASVRANQTTTLDFTFGGTATHRLTFAADGLPASVAWVPSTDRLGAHAERDRCVFHRRGRGHHRQLLGAESGGGRHRDTLRAAGLDPGE